MNYKSNFNVRPSGISSGFVEFERNVVYPELVENGDFSELGSELTTPFSSGWLRIGENNWSLNPAPVVGGIEGIDATSYVYQGISTTIGKQYQVVVDASVTEGSCELRGFNSTNILTISTLGRKTYSTIFTETDGNNNVGFNSSSGFTGVIHSLSVKELGVGWTLSGSASATQTILGSGLGMKMYSGTIADNSNRMSQHSAKGYLNKTYILTLDAYDFIGANTGYIRLDGVYNSSNLISFNVSKTSVTFVADRDFTFIKFFAGSANKTYTINNVSLKEVGEATESALPNQAECEAYGYTWNSGNRTCQAFNPSITLERIAGNLSNNLYGSNNKTQRGTQNSMTIGDYNSLNGSTSNNLIVGSGNSIERKTANNFIVGTAAKSIVDNSFSLGGNNGVANQLDRLGAQLISNPLFDEIGSEEITNGDFATDLSGWASNGILATFSPLLFTNNANNGKLSQGFTTVVGANYKLSIEIISSSWTIYASTSLFSSGSLGSIRETGDLIFTATTTTTYMLCYLIGASGTEGVINNASVKEVGQDWTLSANASIQNNELTLNGIGAFVTAQQTLWSSGAKNGRTLRFIYEVTENTLVSGERATGLLRVGGYSGASLFPSVINLNSDVGTHILDVIVGIEGAHNVFDMYITSDYVSGYIKINYVSLQEVLPFVAPRQMTYLMFGKQTTNGTTKAANLNNTAGTFYVVPLNSASYFQCDVVAVRTGGTSTTGAIGDTASWTEKGVFTNLNQAEGGLTISRERDTVQSIGSGTTNWRPTAVVNNTNGNFGLNVRGATDMIIEWAITVRITQIKTTF
jgi:hypothetical protein